MAKEIDLLLKRAHVVDPVNGVDGIKDIAIANGKIAAVDDGLEALTAGDVHDLDGRIAVPGIIDSHVHASALTGGRYAHKMLAAAGVTTALEMAGPIDSVWDLMKKYGAGLNIAGIQAVAPGFSVENAKPTLKKLRSLFDQFVSKGALGFKILGGHYPLTPASSAACIRIAREKGGYCAFHAGTTETGSDIDGFYEAVELAAGRNLHLAHINSYCRGKKTTSLNEAMDAAKTLQDHPNIFSESYLSPMNGTSGRIVKGRPASKATAMWLEKYGFSADYDGMRAALHSVTARVVAEAGGQMVLRSGHDAVRTWEQMNTDVLISFNINPADSRFALATAKRADGRFSVDCISTDGGGIPRNVIVEKGLALVDFEALSMQAFVLKTSTNPAAMLGMINKGHLGVGADADITVIDKSKNRAFMGIAGGNIIMYAGHVVGRAGTALILEPGKKSLQRLDLDIQLLAPDLFYQRPGTE